MALIHFFAMSSKFFVTIMMVHQKVKVFVLNPLHGWPSGGRKGPFSAQKLWITLVFQQVAVWPLGGPFSGLRAGFWPFSAKMNNFPRKGIFYQKTLFFGQNLMTHGSRKTNGKKLTERGGPPPPPPLNGRSVPKNRTEKKLTERGGPPPPPYGHFP